MQAGKQHRHNTNEYYTEGNNARKLQVIPNYTEEEGQLVRRRTVKQVRKRSKIDSSVDVFTLLVLTVAIAATLYTCIGYLQVQSNVTQMNSKIARMESDLGKMKNDNKDAIAQLNSSVDLEAIYKVATMDLGMVSPKDNQVISYKSTLSDYVKQYKDIPKDNNTTLLEGILK